MDRPKQRRPANGLFQGLDKTDTKLKVMFWNAGGLTNDKYTEIKKTIIEHDVDIFAIAEAGQAADNLLYYQIPGYSISSLKRARQIASGIVIGMKTKYASKLNLMHEMTIDDKHEGVLVEMWVAKGKWSFFFLYNPPNNKCNLAWLENNWDRKSVLLGDLNAHSHRWGYRETNAVGKIIEDFIDSGPVEFIENSDKAPTFLSYGGHKSHPDIVLCHTNLTNIIRHKLTHAPGASGHSILIVEIQNRKFEKNKELRYPRWNFKRANWKHYAETTDRKITKDIIRGNLDQAYKRLQKEILTCARQCVPRGQVKRYTPFWSEALQYQKEQRDQAREKACASGLQRDCVELRHKNAALKKNIILAKRQTYRAFLDQMDFRKDGIKAHKFIGKINGNATDSFEPMIDGRKLLTTEKDIANKFCKVFSKVSNSKPKHGIKIPKISYCLNERETYLSNNSFTEMELDKALSDSKCSKAAGIDGIHTEFLKYMGPSAKSTLLNFINKTWEVGYIPDLWRKGQVIPIIKNGKPKDRFDSYRPITLTSSLCKLAERMILERLNRLIKIKSLISQRQAGFTKNRSAIDQVIHLTQCIKDGFHRSQQTLAIYVDFQSAFDRVWREKLLQKLALSGVRGNLFAWIKSFLSQRYINVKYRTKISGYKQIRQGLPQGSVLSPVLFNCMINDVIHWLTRKIPGTEVLLYADDLVIWSTSSDIKGLQEWANKALRELNKWVEENEMQINPQKTYFQLFSLSTKQHTLDIRTNNVPVQRTNEGKYLGVILDNKLTWAKQIENNVLKSESRLGLMKRLTAIKWGANANVLGTVYKSYVRPVMEYGSEAMVTASNTALSKLDIVQNKALRIVTGAAKSTPIAALELQIGVEPLQLRRARDALIMHERMLRYEGSPWKDYKMPTQRLKTQQSFLSIVAGISSEVGLILEQREPLTADLDFDRQATPININTELMKPVNKSITPQNELKETALWTIHERYPHTQWLHIYTDGSATGASQDGGAGVYCSQFKISKPVGMHASNFDGEMTAINLALNKLAEIEFKKAVLLVDSKAALLAIRSTTAQERTTRECLKKIQNLMNAGKHLALQWIPAHCGINGNEEADLLARQGASQPQPNTALNYTTAKRIIKAAYKAKYLQQMATRSEGKCWEHLLDQPLPLDLPRAVGVACFRLATGHDYLYSHLHKIGVKDTPHCPLCDNQSIMTAEHIFQCTALEHTENERGDLCTRAAVYWAVRKKMAEMPTMA